MLELIAAMWMQEVSEPITAVCVITGDREARMECPDDVPAAEALQGFGDTLIAYGSQPDFGPLPAPGEDVPVEFEFDADRRVWLLNGLTDEDRRQLQDLAVPNVSYYNADRNSTWSSRCNHSRPAVEYPAFAADNKVIGICEAQFDVNPEGQPVNVEVSCRVSFSAQSVEERSLAEMTEVLDEARSALEETSRVALSGWCYERRVIDGESSWRRNVQTNFEFQLED